MAHSLSRGSSLADMQNSTLKPPGRGAAAMMRAAVTAAVPPGSDSPVSRLDICVTSVADKKVLQATSYKLRWFDELFFALLYANPWPVHGPPNFAMTYTETNGRAGFTTSNEFRNFAKRLPRLTRRSRQLSQVPHCAAAGS